MDTNSSGEIDRKKFLSYLDRIQGTPNAVNPSETDAVSEVDESVTSESSGAQSIKNNDLSSEREHLSPKIASQLEGPQPSVIDQNEAVSDDETVSSLVSIENASDNDSEIDLPPHQLLGKILQEKSGEYVSLPEYLTALQLVIAHSKVKTYLASLISLKDENIRDELARIFHHLDVQEGRSGNVKREWLISFLDSNKKIPDSPLSPQTENSPKNISVNSSNSSILWPSPSKVSPISNNKSDSQLDNSYFTQFQQKLPSKIQNQHIRQTKPRNSERKVIGSKSKPNRRSPQSSVPQVR
jgi:hypothetical protein